MRLSRNRCFYYLLTGVFVQRKDSDFTIYGLSICMIGRNPRVHVQNPQVNQFILFISIFYKNVSHRIWKKELQGKSKQFFRIPLMAPHKSFLLCLYMLCGNSLFSFLYTHFPWNLILWKKKFCFEVGLTWFGTPTRPFYWLVVVTFSIFWKYRNFEIFLGAF